MKSKKTVKTTFLSIFAVLLAAFMFYSSGLFRPSERSFFSKQCEHIKSGSTDFNVLVSVTSLGKFCDLNVIGMDGVKGKVLRRTSVCSDFQKDKYIYVTDFTRYGQVGNIELINQDKCHLSWLLTGEENPSGNFLLPIVSVKKFFEVSGTDFSVKYLKENGFKLLKKSGDVWTFHIFPATSIDVQVSDPKCDSLACEETTKISKIIGFKEEYVVESDDGEVIEIASRRN